MRKINIKIIASILAVLLVTAGVVFISAEKGNWTDDGKYDTSWLGDYNNTSAYTVSDEKQLAAFAVAAKLGYTFEGKSLTLTNNLDMSANYWESCFSSEKKFAGSFDGQGHIIRGLEIGSESELGGFLSYNAGTVKNLSIKIGSSAKTSAGIAVYNSANIFNCSVSGELGSLSASNVGGIACENSGNIDNCLNVAALKRSDADTGVFCGGVSAKNQGTVSNCVWSGAEKDISDGNPASASIKYTDSATAVTALNRIASTAGYAEWVQDNTNIYDGYPIMKNAAPAAVSVAGIKFDLREIEMYPQREHQITTTFYPSDASNKALVWLSTNESVATVDETGKITTHKAGYATIRATTVDGGKEANLYVHVISEQTVIKSENIKLDKTEYKLLLGQTVQIMATVLPSNASDKSVMYKIADENIATCDENGVLTPKSSGTTVVTVTSGDGLNSMAAVVTVYEDNYSQTWDGTVAAGFAGGDGTKVNPYIIETADQLAKLANDVNGGNSYEGCYFVQRISIRLNDTTFEDWLHRLSVVNRWIPIGIDSKHVFKGNYDGGGFSVNGIYIDGTSGVAGLFGYTSGGVIQNVNIKHSYIKAGEFAGSLVGYNSAVILKCTSTATVSGINYVGGLVGFTSERIEFCQNSGAVDGEKYVGGVVGYAEKYILNSVNNASILGNECVGGICGKSTAVIENCFNNASVAGDDMCGGIVGQTSMDTVNCHCFIMADGMNNVGAIAGYSDKIPSSYIPSNLTACGNLQNSDDYTLVLGIDGNYTSKKNNRPYLECLNLFGGCIYSDTYFEWAMVESVIMPTTYVKLLSSVSDASSSVELSGAEIVSGNSYAFEDIAGEKLVAALSKINQSGMFEKTKLEVGNVIFTKNITLLNTSGIGSNIQSTSYRLTLPVDFTKIENYDTLGEYEIFAHVAFINITDNEMFIYIPEYVKKGSDGVYNGTMKCLTHIIGGTSVTNYGETAQKYSFYYKTGLMSFSALNTGEWFVAELGENENIVPIETERSEVSAPAPEDPEKRELTFNMVLTVFVCVALFVGGAAILLIQRSKNNIRINSENDQNYYAEEDEI